MIPGVVDSSGGRILTAFSDSFTRSDSTTISTPTIKWQELRGDWSISSNRLSTVTSASTNPIAVVQTNTKNVQVQVGQGSAGFGWGVSFWAIDENNWYVAVTEMTTTTETLYSCPTNTSVVTLVGTTCTYPSSYSATGTTTYSCPSGGTLVGTTCTYPSSYAATGTTTYSCPSGGTLSGTTCVFPSSYAATASTSSSSYSATASYSCSVGTLSGTRCITDCWILNDNPGDVPTNGCLYNLGDGVALLGCSCDGAIIGDPSSCTCYSGSALFGLKNDGSTVPTCSGAGGYFYAGQCYQNAYSGCVNVPATVYCSNCTIGTPSGTHCDLGPADVSYSCPSGGTLSGSTCTITTTTYSCPSGGTLSGTTCVFPANYSATATTTYSCPSGGTLSGTTCVFPANYSATATTTYSCPVNTSIVTLSGTTCVYPANYAATTSTGTNYLHSIVLKRSLASTVTTLATSSTVVTSSSTARPSYVRVITSGENITITAPMDNSSGTISLSHTSTGALRGKKHGATLSSVTATQATNVDNFEYQPA